MHCASCQYDLAGLEAGACPECGRHFDPADPATFAIPGFEHRRHRVVIGVAAAVLLAVMVIGFVVTKDTGVAVFVLMVGVPGLLACFGGIPWLRHPLSPVRMGLSVTPAIVLVGTFYTLAIHMHLSLGGWPGNIGNAGFPSGLRLHADITQLCFTWLFLLLLAWPIAIVILALVRPLRPGVHYLGILAVALALGFGLTQLGPDGFLNWWWD